MLSKWSTGKIFLLAGLASAIAGCGTGTLPAPEGDAALHASTVPGGISVALDAIPPETTRIFVNVSGHGADGTQDGTYGITSSFTDIRGSALDQVKAAGRITYPFVQDGKSYQIAVLFEKDGGDGTEDWAFTECTAAGKGIYFDGGTELNLNQPRTSVALSGEPAFPAGTTYSSAKYRYAVTIEKHGFWSIGVNGSGTGDKLTWNFEPEMSKDLRESGYLQNGDYPAYATAYCNIVHDSLTWAVEIAKSGKFTVSL